MHKLEIPLYIWLNAIVLFAAACYVWGRLSGEAEEQERHVHEHSALGHV